MDDDWGGRRIKKNIFRDQKKTFLEEIKQKH